MSTVKTGFLSVAAIVVLTACAQEIPDSGRGVGFGTMQDFELERARREAALTGTPMPQAQSALTPQTAITPPNATSQAIPSSDLAAAGIGQQGNVGAPMTAMGPASTAPAQTVTPAEPANNVAISDEQDFSAVSSRESIESDAQRLAAAAAARDVAQVQAAPTRSGDAGPNIVQYALTAPNAKGQEWYSRSILSGQRRFQRNCIGYNSPDAAQRDFLARGGPERDPRGIDPDGDGFACGWDPAPFKLAASN